MFEIIKAATIPLKIGGMHEYPFAQMDVGDGFDAPRDMGKFKSGTDRRQSSISANARHYVRRHNSAAKFTVRIIDEHTVRCIRTA